MATSLRELYPAIEPRRVLQLDAGDGHLLHVEECGRPDGIPICFLHGGPGSGSKPYHRRYFDPERYRAVLLDQRGCGRSKPRGETRANDTGRLLADLELVRSELGIEAWALFGGSWGAALALAYAERHPQRVLGIVLRGVFLAREEDVAWFFGADGVRRFYPDAWERFVAALGLEHESAVVAHCQAMMSGADRGARERVARAWSAWTAEVVSFALSRPPAGGGGGGGAAPVAEVGIEAHYAAHGYFLEPGQLLAELGRIPPVPVRIVHGRRDMTCRPECAWLVHKGLPGSRLELVHQAGHLAGETPMVDALIRAADGLAGEILARS